MVDNKQEALSEEELERLKAVFVGKGWLTRLLRDYDRLRTENAELKKLLKECLVPIMTPRLHDSLITRIRAAVGEGK